MPQSIAPFARLAGPCPSRPAALDRKPRQGRIAARHWRREMKTKIVLALLVAGGLAASAAAQPQPQPAPGATPGRPAGAAPPRPGLPPPEPIEHIKDNVYKIF